MANNLVDSVMRAAAEVETWPTWKRNYIVEPYMYAKTVCPERTDLPEIVDIRNLARYERNS